MLNYVEIGKEGGPAGRRRQPPRAPGGRQLPPADRLRRRRARDARIFQEEIFGPVVVVDAVRRRGRGDRARQRHASTGWPPTSGPRPQARPPRRARRRVRHGLDQLPQRPGPAHAVRRGQGRAGSAARAARTPSTSTPNRRSSTSPSATCTPPASEPPDDINRPRRRRPDIVRSAYAELAVTDLAASRWFWVDMLGFSSSRGRRRPVPARHRRAHPPLAWCCARGDARRARPHRLPRAHPPRTSTRRRSSSPSSAARSSGGRRARARRASATRSASWTRSASPSSSSTRSTRAERLIQRYDLHRGAEIARLDHFNICVPDIPRRLRPLPSRSASAARRRSRATSTSCTRPGCTASRPSTTSPSPAAPARACTTSASPPTSRTRSCAAATSSAPCASSTTSSAGPAGTASPTPSTSTCATPTATGRDLHQRLLHRRPRPRDLPLERARRPPPRLLGQRRHRVLVQGGHPRPRPRRSSAARDRRPARRIRRDRGSRRPRLTRAHVGTTGPGGGGPGRVRCDSGPVSRPEHARLRLPGHRVLPWAPSPHLRRQLRPGPRGSRRPAHRAAGPDRPGPRLLGRPSLLPSARTDGPTGRLLGRLRLCPSPSRPCCSCVHNAGQLADGRRTLGCGDTCPDFPGKTYLNWKLDDPAGQGVGAIRPIRDEIQRRIRGLLEDHGCPASFLSAYIPESPTLTSEQQREPKATPRAKPGNSIQFPLNNPRKSLSSRWRPRGAGPCSCPR